METEMVDLFLRVISQAGFPIFVAVWLLLKSDKQMEALTSAIEKMSALIEKCTKNGG